MKQAVWSLGKFEFCPDKSILVDKTRGSEETLNNTLNKIMILLVESQGDVVSRDLICDTGWENKIVTDDSIRQAIKKLREMLDEDGTDADNSCIKTVRGKGYRLDLESTLVDRTILKNEENKGPVGSRIKKGKVRISLIFASVALALTTSFIKDFNLEANKKIKTEKKSIITFERGGEFGVTLADNGNFAYGFNMGEGNRPKKIIIRDRKNTLISEIESIYDNGFTSQPIFSPSGTKLLYLDFGGSEGCIISYYDLMENKVHEIVKCSQSDGKIALDWASETEIVFSTSKSLKFPLQLFKYNLINKAYKSVSKLPIGGRGDYLAKSCEQFIASVRDKNWKDSEIYITDEKSSFSLEQIKGNPFSLDWNDTCSAIYYSNTEGDLYYYELEKGLSERIDIRLDKGSTINYHNHAVYVSGNKLRNSEILSINLNNNEFIPLIKTEGQVYQIKKLKDKILFLSDRSGKYQIWSSGLNDNDSVQITETQNNKPIDSFYYEEEKDKLYYVINEKVYEYRKDSKDKEIYSSDSQIRKFVIIHDKIIYLEYNNELWQLVEYSFKNKEKYTLKGISNLKQDETGRIFISDDESGVYNYLDKDNIKHIGSYVNGVTKWMVSKNELYFYDVNNIYKLEKESGKLSHILELKEGTFSEIYIENEIIYINKITASDTHIARYELLD